VDVTDIPVMIIVGHVEGRRAARGSDVATRGGGGATQRPSLSTSRWCPGLTKKNTTLFSSTGFLTGPSA
jgi:hypothetical protein